MNAPAPSGRRVRGDAARHATDAALWAGLGITCRWHCRLSALSIWPLRQAGRARRRLRSGDPGQPCGRSRGSGPQGWPAPHFPEIVKPCTESGRPVTLRVRLRLDRKVRGVSPAIANVAGLARSGAFQSRPRPHALEITDTIETAGTGSRNVPRPARIP